MPPFKLSLTLLLFTFAFIPIQGQQLIFESESSFSTTHTINKIYHTYQFDDQVLILADTRNKGDLNVLLIIMDLQGAVIKEQLIGASDAFERPIGLIKNGVDYLLFFNQTNFPDRNLALMRLDKNWKFLDEKILVIDNLNEGTAIAGGGKNQNIWISYNVIDEEEKNFPVLMEINPHSLETMSTVSLNQRNDPTINEGSETITIMELDSLGNSVIRGKRTVKKGEPLLKDCNQLICCNDNCTELLLVGVENTSSITDFWVAKINSGNLEWEHIYPSKLGGDEAFHAAVIAADQYIITGLDYTKTKDGNYGFKSMILNKTGEVIRTEIFKKKMRSMYKKTVQLGDHFLMIGDAQRLTYPRTPSENENILEADIHAVMIDDQGNLLAEKLIETKELEVVHDAVALPNNKIRIFFSSNDQLMTAVLKYREK